MRVSPIKIAPLAGLPAPIDMGVLGRHGVVVLTERLRCPAWIRGFVLLFVASLGRIPARLACGLAVRNGNVLWRQFVQAFFAVGSRWRQWLGLAGKLSLLIGFLPIVLGAFVAVPPLVSIDYGNGKSNLFIAMIVWAISPQCLVMLSVRVSTLSLQMIWANALPVAAKMMDIMAAWNRFFQNGFVAESVRNDIFPIVIRKDSVTSRGDSSNPVPAIGLPVELDFCSESFQCREGRSSSFHSVKKDAPHPGSEVRVDWRQPEREARDSVSSTFGGHFKAVIRQYLSPQRTSRNYV